MVFISTILAPVRVHIFNSQQKPISTSTESLYLNYSGSCQESLFFNSQQKFISTLTQKFSFLARPFKYRLKYALKDLAIQQQL